MSSGFEYSSDDDNNDYYREYDYVETEKSSGSDSSDDDNNYSEYDYDASPDDYVQTEKSLAIEETMKALEYEVKHVKSGIQKIDIETKLNAMIMRQCEVYGKAYGMWNKRKEHPKVYGKWTCRPHRGFHRVDIDGSVKMEESGGYGAIARDWGGKFIAAASGVSDNLSVLYNQVQGVKLGLELAKGCGLKRIVVYCNSCFIYQLVGGQCPPYAEDASTVGPVLGEISDLMKGFEDVDFSICLRATNQAADYISKLFVEDKEIKLESHRELRKIVDDDAAGVSYLCEF